MPKMRRTMSQHQIEQKELVLRQVRLTVGLKYPRILAIASERVK
jgi:hypothetical protein